MEDKVLGIKMPEDMKKHISKLIEHSGHTGKEFMQNLINLYQLEKIKEKLPELAEDYRELYSILGRVSNIYYNIAIRVENLNKSKELEFMDNMNKKDKIICKLQDELDLAEKKSKTASDKYNELKSEYDVISKQLNQLEEIKLSNSALISSLNERIKELSEMSDEYKSTKQEVEELRNEVGETLELYHSANSELAIVKEDRRKLLENNKNEIDDLKKRYELDKNAALVEKDKYYQNLINDINEKNVKKINSLLETITNLSMRVNDNSVLVKNKQQSIKSNLL